MSYDQIIKQHYDVVAQTDGLDSHSTMRDETIRRKETEALRALVEGAARAAQGRLSVVDVGCGNGFTLRTLAGPLGGSISFTGFEQNDSMRALAVEQNAAGGVTIEPGDIRDPQLAAGRSFDVLICQRVLINLLSLEDQQEALGNLVRIVQPGGLLVFIECFQRNLENLNEARAEFGLDPLPPAIHNLYLPDDFFARPALRPVAAGESGLDENFLSTHYFISRVLHPAFLGSRNEGFQRNSHFVKFFTAALREGSGEYAPLKLKVFTKA